MRLTAPITATITAAVTAAAISLATRARMSRCGPLSGISSRISTRALAIGVIARAFIAGIAFALITASATAST